MNLGKLNSDDLRAFIQLIPIFENLVEDTQSKIYAKSNEIFHKESLSSSWCHLYELPFTEHLARIVIFFGQAEEVHNLVRQPNPTAAAIQSIKDELTSTQDDIVLEDKDPKTLPLILGLTHSLYLSFKSLLTFGLYLNEQVTLCRKGGGTGDKALFSAIKIDPTMIGCPSFSRRISQALIENDAKFIKNLRKAFKGKITQREVETYKLQRLVFQVLLETGAPKLNSDDLYSLFVDELKITKRDRDSDIGDVAENLRQYAYQFMKQKSVS